MVYSENDSVKNWLNQEFTSDSITANIFVNKISDRTESMSIILAEYIKLMLRRMGDEMSEQELKAILNWKRAETLE